MTPKSNKERCFEMLKDKNFQLGTVFFTIISVSFASILTSTSGLFWGLIGSVLLGIISTIFFRKSISVGGSIVLGATLTIIACLTVGFIGIMQWLF